ncbi:hypothetical protein HPB49_009833 [Dermacentor silvarum]|uniref:Uncharacterized protein n=1 Tax=Dermacentor silvarum TaxID=543639 RepID=A0ACB8DNJ6_DERSI|nr:hypothetical protein HPB49_009833 [Dermacentor silvarum]
MVGPKVQFMGTVHRWFVLMDVSKCTQHIHQKNADCKQFKSAGDERLIWLETNFLDYLADLISNSLAADVRRNTPGLSTVFVVDSPAVDVRRNFLFRRRDSTGVKLLLSESISVNVESSAESGSSTSVTAVAKKAPAGRAAVWSTASTGSCTGRVPAIPKDDAITVYTQY